jgi:hypothetical protein
VSPDPVASGTEFTVTASADDSATGNSTIASAEISIDGGTGQSMLATDGAFDQPTEVVVATVSAGITTGMRQACVTATDAAGYTSEPSCTEFIVYEVSAGKVNGGGWIDIESGACAPTQACASASGKGSFGFTVQHKLKDALPKGNVQFQFHDGDISFHAEDIQNLVVLHPAATIAGVGRLNGVSGIAFRMVVIDGRFAQDGLDRFCIELRAPDGELLFRSSGSDAGLFALPLGGGSLKIDCSGSLVSCGNQNGLPDIL